MATFGTVGIKARPASSNEVMIRFSEPVLDDALTSSSYSITGVTPGSASPSPSSVSWLDEGLSVIVTLSHGMTSGSMYTASVVGTVRAASGDFASSSGSNFTATVPSRPSPVGAFLSEKGFLDITFDRDVGPSSPSATASVSADGGQPVSLSLSAWNPSVPRTSVRFALGGSFPSGSSYVISYGSVRDASLCPSSGSVPLSVPWAGPHSLASLTSPRAFRAHVVRRSEGDRRTVVEALLSCPVDPGSVDASAVLPQSHANADTVNTLAVAAVTDVPSFYAAMTALRSAYQSHLSQDSVHASPGRAGSLSTLCSVLNDAVSKYNDHVSDAAAHASVDGSESVSLPPAHDAASASQLLADLMAKFDAHRVRGGAHVLDDTDYAAPGGPVPTTVGPLCSAVDDMKTRLAMHVGLAYHPSVRASSVPSSEYALESLAYATLESTAQDCCAQLHEASLKLTAHMSSLRHSYPFRHELLIRRIDRSDVTSAMSAANELVSRYSEHVSASGYSVQASVVDASQASGSPDFPSDGHSYRAVVELRNSSQFPYASVTLTGAALDATPLSSTVSAVPGPQAPYWASHLSGSLTVRSPATGPLSARRPSGPVAVGPSSLSMSRPALCRAVRDLAAAYNAHVSEAPRTAEDGTAVQSQHPPGFLGDPIDVESYGPGLDDAVLLMNELASRYDSHVSGGWHLVPAGGYRVPAVALTDPGQIPAAVEALRSSMSAHLSDTSQHREPMRDVLPQSWDDVATAQADRVLDGEPLTVTVHGQYEESVTARADRPMIASAAIIPGFDPVAMTFGPDRIDVTFSKAMSHSALDDETFTVSGGSVTVLGASWAGSRRAAVFVRGTSTGTPYTVGSSGLTDEAGNLLIP